MTAINSHYMASEGKTTTVIKMGKRNKVVEATKNLLDNGLPDHPPPLFQREKRSRLNCQIKDPLQFLPVTDVVIEIIFLYLTPMTKQLFVEANSLKYITSVLKPNLERLRPTYDFIDSGCLDIDDLLFLLKHNNLSIVNLNLSRYRDNLDDQGLKEIIELCPNVKILNICGCKIQDITILSQCPKLEVLNASGSNIKDISVLAECKHLKVLDISLCHGIHNVDVLSRCKSLTKINISFCHGIKDKSSLNPSCV